jgi:hypothetical protein
MNRTKLTSAIRSISTADGYNFYTDGEVSMPRHITAYPALWLAPPRLEQVQGRRHGKVTYSVKLHALRDGLKLSPDERTQAWADMEQDVIDIFAQLSEQEFVVAVEELKVQHTSSSLTNHSEVAVTATAEVVTFF